MKTHLVNNYTGETITLDYECNFGLYFKVKLPDNQTYEVTSVFADLTDLTDPSITMELDLYDDYFDEFVEDEY